MSLVALAAGGMFLGAATSAYQGYAAKKSQEDAQDFAKHMYKHRYQWTMEDMRKAGLNPILAYSQGAGGAPSAGSGYGSPGMQSDIMGDAMDAARSGATAKDYEQIVKNQKEQSWHAIHTEGMKGADYEQAVRTNRALESYYKAQARNVNVNTVLSASTVSAAKSQEKLDKTRVGETLRWINRASRSVLGKDQTSAK